MLYFMYTGLFQLVPIVNIIAIYIVLAFFLSFCWYQWRMIRAYSDFYSSRLDIKWLLPIITGRILRKNARLTNIMLNELRDLAKNFQKDGICAAWFLKPYIIVYSGEFIKYLVNEVNLAEKAILYHINNLLFGNGLLTSLIFEHLTGHVLGLKVDNEEQCMWTGEFFDHVDLVSEEFVERLSRPWLYWNFMLPYFEQGRKFLKTIADIDRHIGRFLNEVLKNQKNGEWHSQNSCGHIIMKLHQESILTKNDLRDHMLTFTTAGYETVSVAMLWCLYTLGHHPEVQENAYNEIQSIAPDGHITYEDLPNLKYLDYVIKETLRLYTTVPMIGRKATTDIQCDPEKFDPERFSDSCKLRPWMYMPFAEGYRNCIGKKYALMEMKINLAYVLRRFRITSLNEINDSDLYLGITLKKRKSLRFLFEDRHDKNYVQEIRKESSTRS